MNFLIFTECQHSNGTAVDDSTCITSGAGVIQFMGFEDVSKVKTEHTRTPKYYITSGGQNLRVPFYMLDYTKSKHFAYG